MKLKQLTIHNLASIEHAFIDFESEPLSSSEVFLITGKTGAGKSTLLDAICLALFADTPRFRHTQMEGKTKDFDNELTISDPRQLMRRNTGEAYVTLTFEGSNGIPYEASWSVARARKKSSGKLQSKKWQLTNLQSHQSFIRDEEIKSEISAAIGLDFEQFCRTTMLAQGEFTRFLNSKDNDRAEILEKITGADKYSKIGKRIYEVTAEKHASWDMIHQQVQGIQILSDEEVAARKSQIQDIEHQIQDNQKGLEKIRKQLQWLNQNRSLQERTEQAEIEFKKEQSITESQEFKDYQQLTRQWNETIEARQRLRDSQKARNEHRSIEQKISELSREIQQCEKEKSALPLETMRNQAECFLTRQNQLDKAVTSCLSAESKQRQVKDAENSQNALNDSIQDIQNRLPLLEQRCHDAEINHIAKRSIYEKCCEQAHEWAKQMRAKLHAGDICPLCLQTLNSDIPHDEEEVAGWFSAADEDRRQAESAWNEAKENLIKARAELGAKSRQFKDGEPLLQRLRAEAEDAGNAAVEACRLCGEDYPSEALSERLQQHSDSLGNDIRQLKESIRNEEKRQGKLISLQAGMSLAKEQLAAATDKEKSASEFLELFCQEKPYTPEMLTDLDQYDQKRIGRIADRIEQVSKKVTTAEATLKTLKKQWVDHQNDKPEWNEDDTETALKTRQNESEHLATELLQNIGAMQQELKTDLEQKDRLRSLLAEAEEKKNAYQKWSELNQFIGDANGAKFRKIAQSYVLSHLIHSANHYLKMLSDRYSLLVEPGTFVISIEDAYQGYSRRAASTISGGESFLVSLSLALALSDIGKQWTVDTLFIDEGFGTLSGEPLQNAVNTLRSLHSQAGRHVGIISHIEELQERIPVQIRVEQKGNSSNSEVIVCQV